MNDLIRMEGITKKYQQGTTVVEALRGINLDIQHNEYTSIIGPSGSGKSTLMYIMGFLETHTDGEYFLEGRSVKELSHNRLAEIRNKSIGFIFQNYNLLTYASALENVELPLIYSKTPSGKRRSRAKELLELVGLSHRIKHRASDLSGGEMQRVAIARALSNSPSVLLADEPTGNLDSKTGEEILAVFEDLWKNGHTVLLITHDQNVAERTQRQIHIRDGRIVNGE